MSDIPRCTECDDQIPYPHFHRDTLDGDQVVAMSDIPRAALPEDMVKAVARGLYEQRCDRTFMPEAEQLLNAAGVPALLEERDRLRAQLLDLVSKSHDADTFDVCTCDGDDENECEGCRAGQAWRAAYSAVRDGD